MSREFGDPCPHCKEGKLTVHPDRDIHENPDGSSGSHRNWLCDKCEEITKDVSRGVVDNIGISDSIKVQKNANRELKDETTISDDSKQQNEC